VGCCVRHLITWRASTFQRETRAALGAGTLGKKVLQERRAFFDVPCEMFNHMLERFEDSFLMTKTWSTVRKKISRSKRTWRKKNEVIALSLTRLCLVLNACGAGETGTIMIAWIGRSAVTMSKPNRQLGITRSLNFHVNRPNETMRIVILKIPGRGQTRV